MFSRELSFSFRKRIIVPHNILTSIIVIYQCHDALFLCSATYSLEYKNELNNEIRYLYFFVLNIDIMYLY